MIAPKSWLQQFVDLKGISDQQFATGLTFAGNKVEAIHHQKETVFEFEITSNRPDTLSIIGLAREAAAIFGRTPVQMIGKHIWTEFPEGVGQPFYHPFFSCHPSFPTRVYEMWVITEVIT